mgnify:CR=1 FL=1
MQVKIGDYVTITEAFKYGKIGDVCKLVEIDHYDKNIPFKIEHPKEGETWCKNIRKATQEEIDSLNLPKLYTIQDLADGVCALKNDGSREDLITILKAAFPKDNYDYEKSYTEDLTHDSICSNGNGVNWTSLLNSLNLPTQSVKDFIKQINTKKDEQNSSNVQRITSENRKPNITGTVILRCGRQQITTGIRPQGNISLPNTGKTRTSVLEIRKNIIQSENY